MRNRDHNRNHLHFLILILLAAIVMPAACALVQAAPPDEDVDEGKDAIVHPDAISALGALSSHRERIAVRSKLYDLHVPDALGWAARHMISPDPERTWDPVRFMWLEILKPPGLTGMQSVHMTQGVTSRPVVQTEDRVFVRLTVSCEGWIDGVLTYDFVWDDVTVYAWPAGTVALYPVTALWKLKIEGPIYPENPGEFGAVAPCNTNGVYR